MFFICESLSDALSNFIAFVDFPTFCEEFAISSLPSIPGFADAFLVIPL